MSTTIVLKKREKEPTYTLQAKPIKKILEAEDGDALLEAFRGGENIEFEEYIHDKRWLSLIAQWQPQKGIPLKEQYRVMKLVDRLADIDEDEEVEFEISDKTKEFIIDRLRHDDFKMNNLSVQFVRFVFDLEEQLDHHIISPEEEPE